MKTVLGLTGGSGCGKSLAANFLKSNGAEIIDADKIARQILEPNEPALKKIADSFSDILLPDGSLNRKKLGNIVFSNKESLHRLNTITHTYIIDEIKHAVASSQNHFIVIDAPLLLECGLNTLCTACACILADKDVRKSRIMTRDNLTEEEAEARISSQKDDEYYKSRCQFIIENNSDPASLEQSLTLMLKELLH